METTIKLQKETKQRLSTLSIAEKGKSFDMIVNELITYHMKMEGKYKKDYIAWKKRDDEYTKLHEQHKKNVKKWKEEEQMWKRLLKWAKTQGFKG